MSGNRPIQEPEVDWLTTFGEALVNRQQVQKGPRTYRVQAHDGPAAMFRNDERLDHAMVQLGNRRIQSHVYQVHALRLLRGQAIRIDGAEQAYRFPKLARPGVFPAVPSSFVRRTALVDRETNLVIDRQGDRVARLETTETVSP